MHISALCVVEQYAFPKSHLSEIRVLYAKNIPGEIPKRTSLMCPSQNFLLYNRNIIKMKVTEWINNLKKYVNPPPLWGYIQHVQIITI